MSLRHVALGVALREESRGVRESKPNWGEDVKEYLANCDPPITVPAPWCAAFVQFCADVACRGLRQGRLELVNPLDEVQLEALVQSYVDKARQRGWVIPAHAADAGDLVAFQFGHGQRFDHIGILLRPPAIYGATIEVVSVDGNTDDAGGREGVKVAVKKRKVPAGKVVFIRWDAGVAL